MSLKESAILNKVDLDRLESKINLIANQILTKREDAPNKFSITLSIEEARVLRDALEVAGEL